MPLYHVSIDHTVGYGIDHTVDYGIGHTADYGIDHSIVLVLGFCLRMLIVCWCSMCIISIVCLVNYS